MLAERRMRFGRGHGSRRAFCGRNRRGRGGILVRGGRRYLADLDVAVLVDLDGRAELLGRVQSHGDVRRDHAARFADRAPQAHRPGLLAPVALLKQRLPRIGFVVEPCQPFRIRDGEARRVGFAPPPLHRNGALRLVTHDLDILEDPGPLDHGQEQLGGDDRLAADHVDLAERFHRGHLQFGALDHDGERFFDRVYGLRQILARHQHLGQFLQGAKVVGVAQGHPQWLRVGADQAQGAMWGTSECLGHPAITSVDVGCPRVSGCLSDPIARHVRSVRDQRTPLPPSW